MGYWNRTFYYRLEIAGLAAGDFSEVSGFDTSIDMVEYREGNFTTTPRQVPGLKKYGNITLRQGLMPSKVVSDWIIPGVTGNVQNKTITITLVNETGEDMASWQVLNAWPTKYSAPDFDVTASDVAVESLEITHEGMNRI